MRAIGLLLLAAILLTGCAALERREPVAPGTVPPSARDASWQDLPIAYCIVPGAGFVDRQTLARLVRNAFDAWGVAATHVGDCEAAVPARNGVNEIAWGNLSSSSGELHQAGETTLRYRHDKPLFGGGGDEPEIIEADIVVEGDPPRGLDNEKCLYTTLLHETGHVLGAQHSEPPAVMAPMLTSCPQNLTRADLDQVSHLYGVSP